MILQTLTNFVSQLLPVMQNLKNSSYAEPLELQNASDVDLQNLQNTNDAEPLKQIFLLFCYWNLEEKSKFLTEWNRMNPLKTDLLN